MANSYTVWLTNPVFPVKSYALWSHTGQAVEWFSAAYTGLHGNGGPGCTQVAGERTARVHPAKRENLLAWSEVRAGLGPCRHTQAQCLLSGTRHLQCACMRPDYTTRDRHCMHHTLRAWLHPRLCPEHTTAMPKRRACRRHSLPPYRPSAEPSRTPSPAPTLTHAHAYARDPVRSHPKRP